MWLAVLWGRAWLGLLVNCRDLWRRADKRQAPATSRRLAPWPPPATQAAPAEPQIVAVTTPPLVEDMTFSSLLSKTVFAPIRHFDVNPAEPPYRTFQFASRDDGAAELGIDGTLEHGSFAGHRLTVLQLGCIQLTLGRFYTVVVDPEHRRSVLR